MSVILDAALRLAVESMVAAARGGRARVREARAVDGGCINAAHEVVLDDGGTVFVKSNARAPAGLFEREAQGLEALRAVGAIRVPQVVGVGVSEQGVALLVLEYVASAPVRRGFYERLGRELAALHRAGGSERAGFADDNYLGTTPQPNRWTADWTTFFAEQRLGHQLELARRAGRIDGPTLRLGERVMARLGALLGASAGEPMALLHGDLWSGNVLVAGGGAPLIFDPAAYYGHREAELAMMALFGGFDARCFAAYDEVWPLCEGWRERLELYGLYHLLNHLNLFGGSYLGRCRALLERFGG